MELFEAQSAGVPRQRAAPRGHRAPGGRAGRHDELVEVGRHSRRRARPRPLRRLRARRARPWRSSASPPITSLARARALLYAARGRRYGHEPLLRDDAPQPSPPAPPLRAGAERVGGLPLARLDPRRAPAGADRRGRGRRRDLQPDDLPEGDDAKATPTTSSCASSRRGGPAMRAKTSSGALAERDIKDACDLFRPIWDGGSGRDGYVSLEVDPGSRLRHAARPSRRRCACTRRWTART